MMPSTGYIRSKIAQGEGQSLDFKFYISSASKIAKSLVAFANTDGGTLLIGVKDNGNIVGVKSEEEMYMIEYAAEAFCKPIVKYSSKEHLVDGKIVLEVKVHKSDFAPHTAKDDQGNWNLYIRQKDENILTGDIMYNVILNRTLGNRVSITMDNKEKMLMDYLKQNPKIDILQFCKMAGIPQKTAEKIISNLISVGLLKPKFEQKGEFYALPF